MKIVLLGGLGLQGKAALADLAGSPAVQSIICADTRLDAWETVADIMDTGKIDPVRIDAADKPSLIALFKQGVDAVIDLLPPPLMRFAFEAAIAAGVPLVSTNYSHSLSDLDQAAKSAGVALMTECGLDPGIDLVLYQHALQGFDEIHVINSYCGGLPEASACDNPLNYKISWNWAGVLNSTRRDARAIRDGQLVEISADRQHDPKQIHDIEFPGLGRLEAIPNGDGVHFTDLLGVTETIRETGRYSLRWPGWSAFWNPLKQLGFLSDTPVPGLPCQVSPFQFLAAHLGPRLQYEDNQKDLAVMVNVFEGLSGGKRIRRTIRILIERDLETGVMAMSKGVGFPASIVAQMIAAAEITATGILSPIKHVPSRLFLDRLCQRGIRVEEAEEILS